MGKFWNNNIPKTLQNLKTFIYIHKRKRKKNSGKVYQTFDFLFPILTKKKNLEIDLSSQMRKLKKKIGVSNHTQKLPKNPIKFMIIIILDGQEIREKSNIQINTKFIDC